MGCHPSLSKEVESLQFNDNYHAGQWKQMERDVPPVIVASPLPAPALAELLPDPEQKPSPLYPKMDKLQSFLMEEGESVYFKLEMKKLCSVSMEEHESDF